MRRYVETVQQWRSEEMMICYRLVFQTTFTVSPHTLIPFAVDLFGGLGPAARQFFLTCHRQRQQTQGQNEYVPWRISWSESWRQRLSVTLARAISRVIRLRAGNSFTEAFLASGHAEVGTNPDWQGRLVDSTMDVEDTSTDIVCVGHVHADIPLQEMSE